MSQHALVLTREAEATHHGASSSQGVGIPITLTLNAAQVSAVVSAALSEESEASHSLHTSPASSSSLRATASRSSVEGVFTTPRSNIKLVNPKTTIVTTETSEGVTRTITHTLSANEVESSSTVTRKTSTESAAVSGDATTVTKVFNPSSAGGVKAVVTSSSELSFGIGASASSSAAASSSSDPQSSNANGSSSAAAVTTSSNAQASPSQATSSGSSVASGSSSRGSSSSSSTRVSRSTVTVTARASSNTRIFGSTIVAKPVITEANGSILTLTSTTGTAFITSTLPPGGAAQPTGQPEPKTSLSDFFKSIDSSPTAIALTTLISTIVVALLGLAVWFCLKRRSRLSKRRPSLFDFAPDANAGTTNARAAGGSSTKTRSIASSYSEKTPLALHAYAFGGDHNSFGYDSRHVEAPLSTPTLSASGEKDIAPHDISPFSNMHAVAPATAGSDYANDTAARTSAVRFANIYPALPASRRKSSPNLSLEYLLNGAASPMINIEDTSSTRAETHGASPSAASTYENQLPNPPLPMKNSPPLVPIKSQDWINHPDSDLNTSEESHDSDALLLQVPRRPARPASLSGSITRKIEEMYKDQHQVVGGDSGLAAIHPLNITATPRSSFSVLPSIPKPWMRQARRWASMSSMGGATGPTGIGAGDRRPSASGLAADRRPSVDRRLYQQQLPSRFSITTFATSVEGSPDLNAFRARRTAVVDHNLSILRTDIFKTAPGDSDAKAIANGALVNPFADSARVVEIPPKEKFVEFDMPSPTSSAGPWASTEPLRTTYNPTSALAISVPVHGGGDESSEEDEEEGSQETMETASEETASAESAIDEDDEDNIRALIKRRQSAASQL